MLRMIINTDVCEASIEDNGECRAVELCANHQNCAEEGRPSRQLSGHIADLAFESDSYAASNGFC